MNRAEKIQETEDLKNVFGKASAIFVTDYRGLTVAEMTALRFELKKANTDYRVVKNRLALRALEGKSEDFRKAFDHTTAVALTYGDVVMGAKAVTKFAGTNDKFKIRSAMVEGKVTSPADVKALSKLPSKQELLAKLLGTWTAVPGGFVRVLHGVPAKFVYALEALRKKKEQGQ